MILEAMLSLLQSSALSPNGANPGSRESHVLVYDNARGELLLFGGRASDDSPVGTWSWRDGQWTYHGGEGPTDRSRSSIVYMDREESVVLYGGHLRGAGYSDVPFSDTWSLKKRQWLKLETLSPQGRIFCAGAYDRERSRFVLTSGRDPLSGSYLNETWEFGSGQWIRLNIETPPSLWCPQLVYDEKAKALVLLATNTSTGMLNVWEFDGERYLMLSENGPKVLLGDQAASSVGAAGGVLVFGGVASASLGKDLAKPQYVDETWRWNEGSWRKIEGKGPSARSGHAMAYNRNLDSVMLYGGSSKNGTEGDMWEFKGDIWKRIHE